jgi:excisionase family DNA binding protein
MIDRVSNRRQNAPLEAVARISGNTRARPLTKLRTIDEIAERWDVSPRTVQRQIKSGALRSHRIGRLRRISDADAAAFLNENRDD